MRTLPSYPNQPFRDALDAGADATELLLASTLALAHDGSLDVDDDGRLPKGEPLPLGISRSRDGTWLLGAYTDMAAIMDPDAPTAGEDTPTVPIAGDDLVLLAAANHVGIHVNPGSEEQLVLEAARIRELADWLRTQRAGAGVRTFDRRTLVTLHPQDEELSVDRRELLLRELVARGAAFAFVARYALHDEHTEPALDDFHQLIVVGDEDGRADYELREDARRVLTFLTGEATDSVAYDAMPQVRHVAEPILQPSGPLPEPLIGVV
ncbi:MAG: SseB family protein [Thermoleophilia bacterium]|nr:SseB family protein [Thermoleophilia bacterium]